MASSSSSSPRASAVFRFVLKWIVLPYIIGVLLSEYVPEEITDKAVQAILGAAPGLGSSGNASSVTVSASAVVDHDDKRKLQQQQYGQEDEEMSDICWQRFVSSLDRSERLSVQKLMHNPQDGVKVVLHRNGDVKGCGSTLTFLHELRFSLNSLGKECPVAFSKYEVESILTSAFHQSLGESCISQESDREEWEGFLGYCDMGTAKTPILLDHDKLVPVSMEINEKGEEASYLPCKFHSREGVRLTSFQAVVERIVQEYTREEDDDEMQCDDKEETCSASEKKEKEVHFYAVPAGRVFMFAPAYIGEIFDLPHIQGADPSLPVYMEVLSLSPRVFDIFNYFTREESAGLVEKAKKETSETHRIKRSSTGASGYNVNSRRTSESGFDTHGTIAQKVKRRCFSVLGFDEYIEGHSDGLQILRYNQTKAYTAHMDWIDDDGKQDHDYNSEGKGGNRYATILLYMTDLGEEDGGETVFVNARSAKENGPTYKEALADLRASEQSSLFARDSWEEKMVARCRSSLAIRPNSARAVLFYSQHPNGKPDKQSLHGGCPVITSTPKWAANLWVWNTPRAGFEGAPMNEQRLAEKRARGEKPTVSSDIPPKKHVTFKNSGKDPLFENAELFYMDSQFWGYLTEDQSHAVNSYEGQVWNVKVNGEIKKTFTVNKKPVQVYTV